MHLGAEAMPRPKDVRYLRILLQQDTRLLHPSAPAPLRLKGACSACQLRPNLRGLAWAPLRLHFTLRVYIQAAVTRSVGDVTRLRPGTAQPPARRPRQAEQPFEKPENFPEPHADGPAGGGLPVLC
eukprot:61833-Pyramimonas_sp.AAC.2